MMNSLLTRKNAGFTLIELMISMGVTLVLLSAAVAAFRSAQQTNQIIAEGADLSENLRAGMNMMQLDIQQAGTGIPTGGIPIPFTSPCGSTAPINRPKLNGTTTFPYPGALTCESSIPAVEPGNELGPAITAPDAVSGTPANPNSITDEITILYADNSVGLDAKPVNQPPTANPANAGCPNGKMQYSGTTLTVTFDVTCVNLTNASGNSLITINPGDLIAFQNANGTALLWVTSVSGQVLSFQKGDPFDLNGRTDN